MKLLSQTFTDGAAVPQRCAFCAPADAQPPLTMSDNRNPHLAWSEVPAGTLSFALVCCDPDVPSVGDDVNQAGRRVPSSLPRVDFYHWLLWNIPADVLEIAEATCSDGVTARGKSGPKAKGSTAHGLNDYTGWFAEDPDMTGDYYGYDGPCPPWNDERLHHYVFTIYALDVESLSLGEAVTGAQLLDVIEPHIVGQASMTGTYTLNPSLLSA